MLQGLVGALLAVAAVFIGHNFLAGLEPEDFLIRFSVGSDFLIQWGLLILLFGAVAGVIGSGLGLRRFLRV